MATTLPLHPSLPPKPLSQPSTSTSASASPLCSSCHLHLPKYTCPACTSRTCSLPCSSAHKARTGCSGQRNKAAYVPMNQYTWGTMVDDYVFLEEVGRKVGEVGKEIGRGGYAHANAERGRGRGRGGGRNVGGRGSGHSKRDTLKMQLEIRDIELDLLPLGMERRKLNQSTWDPKKQTAFLTIEFKFHPPKDPLRQAPSAPYTLLTHRNDLKKPLLTLLRDLLTDTSKSNKKSDTHPDWLRPLIFPDPDDPEGFINPQCLMAAHHLDTNATKRTPYYAFDPTQPLATVLKHTRIVEFPTIQVWEDFEGTIVDAQGNVKQEAASAEEGEDGAQRPVKRRKMNMNPKAGKKAIAGLLGGYGSSEDENEAEGDQEQEERRDVLAVLGDYVDSENEDEDGEGREADLDLSDGDPEVDPAALLELVRSVQGGQPWAIDNEDDAVDWGDDDELETEL